MTETIAILDSASDHAIDPMTQKIIEQLETVYDPEVPLIDIYTLGLIYKIEVQEDTNTIVLTMTFTTPACPMGDAIKEMTENAILDVYPEYDVLLHIVFDPMWSPDMIKDEDLKRMFM
ncbi:metal-sulfur cluster assembly factor [bacterium]|nr:metal-sulfur cluster assembly factor [bacterium]